jgi:plasmid stabilization system protein ParE
VRVIWTELAFAQLDEAMAYIAVDSPQTAAHWLEAILDAAGQLAEFPESGRIVPEAAREDIRELIFSPYRLIYLRASEAVYVTMVLHERQHVEPEDVVGG